MPFFVEPMPFPVQALEAGMLRGAANFIAAPKKMHRS